MKPIYYLRGLKLIRYIDGKEEVLKSNSPILKGTNIITLPNRLVITHNTVFYLFQLSLSTFKLQQRYDIEKDIDEEIKQFAVNPSGTAFILVTQSGRFILKDYKNNIEKEYEADYGRLEEPKFGFLNDNYHYILFTESPAIISANSNFSYEISIMNCEGLMFYALRNGYFITAKFQQGDDQSTYYTNQENDVSLYYIDNEGNIKTIKKLFNLREISGDFDSEEYELIESAYLQGNDLICEIAASWTTEYYSVYYYWDISNNAKRTYLLTRKNKDEDVSRFLYTKSQLSCIRKGLLKYINKNLTNIVSKFIFPSDIDEECDSTPWFKLLKDHQEGNIGIIWE
jgi:hypothetical protein